MNMKDIENALKNLSRPFTGEADFQFALAWEIKTMHPNAKINLEYRYLNSQSKTGRDSYIDIVVEDNGEIVFIELKYKTKKFNGTYGNITYNLHNHSAHDCARYDFWKDVERLENFIGDNNKANHGYAIFLTNDKLYWNQSKKITIDNQFLIYDGRNNISGTLNWQGIFSPGTIKGRSKSIMLKGNYGIKWHPYILNSSFEFYYTIIDI